MDQLQPELLAKQSVILIKQNEQKLRSQNKMSLYQQQENNLLYEEQLNRDTAQLGQKVDKAKNQEQIEKNKRIDAAKKLTKKATAYTLELYDSLNAPMQQKDSEQMLMFLESTQFTKEMFASANIHAHFMEYITLIRFYDQLQQSEDPAISERLQRYHAIMPLFRDRISLFAKKNRLNLDGSVISDKEKVTGKVDIDVLRQWENAIAQKQDSYDPDAVAGLSQEALQEAINQENVAAEPGIVSLNQVRRYSIEDRIRNLPLIRKMLKDATDSVDAMNSVINSTLPKVQGHQAEGLNPEERALYNQTLQELRENKTKFDAMVFELTATIELATLEAQYLSAKERGEDTAGIKTHLLSAHKLYASIQTRELRQELSGTAIRTTGNPKIAGISRLDAMTTDSDSKNLAFKKKLDELNAVMRELQEDPGMENAQRKKLLKACDAVQAYADCTHYSVGYQEEINYLKKAQHALADLEAVYPGMASVQAVVNHIQGLTMGTTTNIPSVNEIPAKFLKDCRGRHPEEYRARAQGKFKNAMVNNALSWYWSNQRDTPLFAHEPTVNDLRQGKICNCWMVAAATALINYDPQIIKDAFRDNGDGTVTVRLFKLDTNPPEPMFYVVDKEVPRMVTGGELHSSGALWMQMLEKAIAFHGHAGSKGYSALWYSSGDQLVTYLTGKPGDFPNHFDEAKNLNIPEKQREEAKQEFFKDLCSAKERGVVLTGGTGRDVSAGFNGGHAYTILGGKIEGGVPYVILRNPYGNMSLQYDENGQQHRQGGMFGFFSSTLDETFGQFAVTLDDFLKNFSAIHESDLQRDGGIPKTDLQGIADFEAKIAERQRQRELQRQERLAAQRRREQQQKENIAMSVINPEHEQVQNNKIQNIEKDFEVLDFDDQEEEIIIQKEDKNENPSIIQEEDEKKEQQQKKDKKSNPASDFEIIEDEYLGYQDKDGDDF